MLRKEMEMSPSGGMLNSDGRGDIWLKGADGERQSIRVDSRVTEGAYSVIESVVANAVAQQLLRRDHLDADPTVCVTQSCQARSDDTAASLMTNTLLLPQRLACQKHAWSNTSRKALRINNFDL
jgi:hypothetical protein